jgi:hypothetical protein
MLVHWLILPAPKPAEPKGAKVTDWLVAGGVFSALDPKPPKIITSDDILRGPSLQSMNLLTDSEKAAIERRHPYWDAMVASFGALFSLSALCYAFLVSLPTSIAIACSISVNSTEISVKHWYLAYFFTIFLGIWLLPTLFNGAPIRASALHDWDFWDAPFKMLPIIGYVGLMNSRRKSFEWPYFWITPGLLFALMWFSFANHFGNTPISSPWSRLLPSEWKHYYGSGLDIVSAMFSVLSDFFSGVGWWTAPIFILVALAGSFVAVAAVSILSTDRWGPPGLAWSLLALSLLVWAGVIQGLTWAFMAIYVDKYLTFKYGGTG